MYQCPGCGGELHFDIPSQQIKCTYCHSLYNPYQFKEKNKDAEESQYFETVVHTCPQCGGEVYTVENEAASFCSFCGASTILMNRLNKEERPAFIIPFKKTKQDCIDAYSARMKKAFFAPKELRSAEYLSAFRGIYMPYWTYQIDQNGHSSMPAYKQYRRGDYIYTDHYQLSFDLDASYAGFSFDASSSFYDSISEDLAPYNTKELVSFDPTFLLGFYADTADVPAGLYQGDAVAYACDQTSSEIRKVPSFHSYTIPADSQSIARQLPTNCRRSDRTLFPVWFLTYQQNNRVAYVTMNGQTGKIVGDIPVDGKKYALFSLLLAIPLFGFLELFHTITSVAMTGITSLLAFIVTLIYCCELDEIYKKDSNQGDKGLIYKQTGGNSGKLLQNKMKKAVGSVFASALIFVIAILLIVFSDALINTSGYAIPKLFVFVSAPCTLIATVLSVKQNKQIDESHFSFGILLCSLATIISALIVLTDVASDIPYYVVSLVTSLFVMITILDIIRNYNVLSTRKLPQFQKMGGNHNAY